MPALTALPFSTLVFSTRGLPAFIGTTFGATQGEEPPKRTVNPLEERHNIDFPQSSNPDIPAIIFHNSRLIPVLPKKNPTAHSNGLSRDTTKAWATTLLDCNTQEPTGRTFRVRPVDIYLYQFNLYNHQSTKSDIVFPQRNVCLIPISIASSLVLPLNGFIYRYLSRRYL